MNDVLRCGLRKKQIISSRQEAEVPEDGSQTHKRSECDEWQRKGNKQEGGGGSGQEEEEDVALGE